MSVISDAVINISVHNFLFALIVTSSFHLKEQPHPLLFLQCSPGLRHVNGRILVCSLHVPSPSLSDNSPLCSLISVTGPLVYLGEEEEEGKDKHGLLSWLLLQFPLLIVIVYLVPSNGTSGLFP